MTDVRQAFEEWAIEKGPCTSVRKGADGAYHSGLTEYCWSAWQAAWKSGVRSVGAQPAPRGNLPGLYLDSGEFIPTGDAS